MSEFVIYAHVNVLPLMIYQATITHLYFAFQFAISLCLSFWIKCKSINSKTSQWRHNERYGVPNHQRLDCLLNRLFRPNKTSKFRVTGLCEGIITRHRRIPLPKGQYGGKCFHLMTSSNALHTPSVPVSTHISMYKYTMYQMWPHRMTEYNYCTWSIKMCWAITRSYF